MGRDPRVLAAFAQTHLRVLDASPELAGRVRQVTPTDALVTLEKSSRISWIPIAASELPSCTVIRALEPRSGRDPGC